MLLVLVGLEHDSSQRGITLYRLGRAHGAVFGVETAVENILQVVLHAGGRLGGIVVEVVDVNVALAVRPPVAHPHQILIGVILGHLRGEGHHLPGRRMRRHVGIAQVHVVLLDSHDAVHHLLHRGAFLALLGAPLAIDDEALGHRRVAPHQMALDQILNLLDRNLALVDGGGHLAGNLFHRSFVVDTIGPIGLGNSPLDFGNRETLLGTIALGNGNACIIHVDKLFRVGYCGRLLERPFASLSLRQVFWLFPAPMTPSRHYRNRFSSVARVTGLSQELQQRDCSGFSPDSLFIDTIVQRGRTGMRVQSYTNSR